MIPSFQAQTANGGELDSNAFHGRRLVVSFFSSQCPRCVPTLRATSETYAGLHDVTFVGVVDGDVHTALALSKEFGIRFPLVLDEGRQIARRFQVEDVPITFVADSRGWVSWVGGADLTEAALASALSAAR